MAKQNEQITTLDTLPAILTATHISMVMGLSKPLVYNLMNRDDFPSIKIGKRLIVPKNSFETWLAEPKKEERK